MKWLVRATAGAALAVFAHAVNARSIESKVEITFTPHGIPHIRASDFAGLGYGYGYTAASIDLCAIAEVFIDVRGERALYFGGSATGSNPLQRRNTENLANDFAVHLLVDEQAIAAQRAGLTAEARELVQGYADGFNRYLSDTPTANRPRACRDAQWVKPITADDVLRRVANAVFVGTSFAAELYDAHPPSSAPPAAHATAPKVQASDIQASDAGSNAIALGSQHTSHGRGLLLGNPHWFWGVPNRFMQAHLTIAGKYDVSGVSVIGMPLIIIGYNQSTAWTHTVATDHRATVFELILDPADPTRYLLDGQSRPLQRREVRVEIRNEDGSTKQATHTFWLSDYGPIVQSAQLPWSSRTAYALADGAANDTRYLRQLIEMGEAKDVRDLERKLANTLGLVWINTLAVDSHGEALYADYSVIPNVPRDLYESCTKRIAFPQATLANVMDGSRSACAWRVDARSRSSNAPPGSNIMPATDKPAYVTRDYVENSNSSYWLVNAAHPLEGFSPMIGRERSPPNLRTRFGHLLATEFNKQANDVERGDMERLESLLFSNRDYLAELVLDDLLQACSKSTAANGLSPHLREACAVLSRWNRKDELDSVGATLFREFAREEKPAGEEDPATVADFWSTPFDPAQPLTTPRGLNTSTAAPLAALSRAADRLVEAGAPFDEPLGEVQFIERNGRRIPLHGGLVFNRISLTLKPRVGYTEPIGSATSYIQVVTFDSKGPVADTLLVNSQSGDPDSPWYADQADLYSRKEWVHVPFFRQDIQSQAIGKPLVLVYSIDQ